MNYYNEFDPKAAAWLQQLIDDKQIPYGYVDSRSILEVQPSDLRGFTQCHFFAGIGGWSLALRLAGWSDDKPVWTASLPCQPFSAAGKQLGTDDERHLAPTFLELVRQCHPPVLLGEQVASKLARTDWLPGIRLEFQTLGYSFGAADLCAPCAGEIGEGWIVRGDQESWERVIIGAPHIRQRLYWVAQSCDHRTGGILRETSGCGREPVDAGTASLRQAHGTTGTSRVDPRGTSCVDGLADAESDHEYRVGRCSGEGVCEGDEWRRRDVQTDSSMPSRGLSYAECGRSEKQRTTDYFTGGQSKTFLNASGGSSTLLLPCRDGKTRRTQSGIFPLVDGLPRGVVPSGDPGDPSYANATSEARAVRLKGYGNAIAPYLAAMFIQSYREAVEA